MVKTRNMLRNNAAVENVYSQNNSVNVEVVPYVYKAGGEELQRRRSPRLAALNKKTEKPVQSYKSIIKTRAQKAKEHQKYLDTMFSDINSFYKSHGYEPSPFATSTQEAVMGKFVMALRNSYNYDGLGGKDNVDLVMRHLPWFKFDVKDAVTQWSKRAFSTSDIVFMGFLSLVFPVVMLTTQYLLDKCYFSNQCPAWVTNAYSSTSEFVSVTGFQLIYAMMLLKDTIKSFGTTLLTIV
jgi:hypothetical protein